MDFEQQFEEMIVLSLKCTVLFLTVLLLPPMAGFWNTFFFTPKFQIII